MISCQSDGSHSHGERGANVRGETVAENDWRSKSAPLSGSWRCISTGAVTSALSTCLPFSRCKLNREILT